MNWQKSSYCSEGESCVHVAADETTILLTESSDPSGAILRMPPAEFGELVADIKGDTSHKADPEGTVHLGPVTTTSDKWLAFQQGVRNGEFDHLVTGTSQNPDRADKTLSA